MDHPFIRLPSSSSYDSMGSNLSEPRESHTSSTSHKSTEASTPPVSPPPEPNTHNTSRAKYHVKDIGEFASALEISANRALPNRGQSRYSLIKVLLLRWEENHLNVEQELGSLSNVFQDYGFETETWLIPTESPDRKILRKALDFIDDYESEDTLLIVYYGGHATINQAQQATWSCTRDLEYSSFEWNGCQRLFEKSISDVLLLLDCCSAAAAATASSPARTDSITEIIAACGWETWAPEPGCHSFTNALIAVLQDRSTPFSAAMLHSEVLAFLKQSRPRRYAREYGKTPVYVLSASDPNKCSIELARRADNASTSHGDEQAPLAPSTSVDDLAAKFPPMTPSESSPINPSSFIATGPDNNFILPHVIMSIALESDQHLDVRAFARWLRQFPALAQYAKIQGVYRGYSTLVLAALPVVIWNLLPENPAYNFVGYARSDNLYPTKGMQKPTKRRSPKVPSPTSTTNSQPAGSNDAMRSGLANVEATKENGSNSKSRFKENSSLQVHRFTSGTDIFTQVIDRALKTSANLPAKNWALAVELESGVEVTYTSPRLAPYRTRIFNPRFNHDFHRYVRGTDDSYPNSGYASDISSASTLVFGPSRYRTGSIDSRNEEQLEEDDDSSPSKRRSQSTSTQNILATLTRTETHQPKDLGDSRKLERFYFARFQDIQQSACRQLARAFVKLIDPQKQTQHPYRNGNMAAPDWWPSTRGVNAVRHKEPDHLLKNERITLLVHILWMVARPKDKQPEAIKNSGLDIESLERAAMEALDSWLGNEEHPDKISKQAILKEIFEVAKAEEKFQKDRNSISAETPDEKLENKAHYTKEFDKSSKKHHTVSTILQEPIARH